MSRAGFMFNFRTKNIMFAYLQSVPILIRIPLDGQDTEHHMASIMNTSITFKEEIVFSFSHLGHLFFGDTNYNIYNEHAKFVAKLPQEELKFNKIRLYTIFESDSFNINFQPFRVYARAELRKSHLIYFKSKPTLCELWKKVS